LTAASAAGYGKQTAGDESEHLPGLSMHFIYESALARVVFFAGALSQLPAEVERLGRRALILSTPGHRQLADDVARSLGARSAGVFAGAMMHVPIQTAQAGRLAARDLKADCLVAIGGGSTTGLAKAIALELELPILAVPTTYAGSELTAIWGLTENSRKRTGVDPRVRPKTVLYDPELTAGLPFALSLTSAINAVAHCVEALYAQQANPALAAIAEEGIRLIAASLPILALKGVDPTARERLLCGAWLGGIALDGGGGALHHKLCHTLGGSFNLPHAETHTVVLPHALAYNAPAVPEAIARIGRALESNAPAGALYDLIAKLGGPTSLRELGMRAEDLEPAVELALQNPYYNPRPITRDGVRALLQAAFEGRRPTAT
jgi:maleylacetate reductase